MNRILRGTVLLAVTALVGGCNTEPEETQGGDPDHIEATPAVVFVDRGASEEIFVRLVDQQGTSLSTEVSLTGVDPAVIGVSADSMFRPVFGPDGVLGFNTNNSELRLVLNGLTNGATSFTITADGETLEVPVTVLPVEVPSQFSSEALLIGDTLTVTVAAPFRFLSDLRVEREDGTLAGQTLSVGADGLTAVILPTPGVTQPLQFDGITLTYAPTLDLTVPAAANLVAVDDSIVRNPYTGFDAVATAPELPFPAAGESATYFDAGTAYPGADPDPLPDGNDPDTDPDPRYNGARFYRIVVPEAGVYDIGVTYTDGKDLGLFLYTSTGEFIETIADAHGNGADASPEVGDVTLAAGTYIIAVGLFDYGTQPLPDYLQIEIGPHVE